MPRYSQRCGDSAFTVIPQTGSMLGVMIYSSPLCLRDGQVVRQHALGVHHFAQCCFFCQKCLHCHWIELCAAHPDDLVTRLFECVCFAIRPVRSDCVEGIYYGEQSRPQTDLFATQPAWITASIETLLMAEHDFGGFFHIRNLRDDAISFFRGSTHFIPLILIR